MGRHQFELHFRHHGKSQGGRLPSSGSLSCGNEQPDDDRARKRLGLPLDPADVSLQRLVLHLGRECDGRDPCLFEKILPGDGVPAHRRTRSDPSMWRTHHSQRDGPCSGGGETKLQIESRDRHRRSGSSQPCDRCPRTNGF